jgi:hypothetical protein
MTQYALITNTRMALLRLLFKISMRPWLGWVLALIFAVAVTLIIYLTNGKWAFVFAVLLILQLPLLILLMRAESDIKDQPASTERINAALSCVDPQLRSAFLIYLDIHLQKGEAVIGRRDLVHYARIVRDTWHARQQKYQRLHARTVQVRHLLDLTKKTE